MIRTLKILFYISSIFFCNQFFAQETMAELDSNLSTVRLLINEDKFENAIQKAETVLTDPSTSNRQKGTAKLLIALAHHNLGQYNEAHTNYEKALELQESISNSDSLDLAETYRKFGMLKASMGDMEKSVTLINKGLSILLENLGPDNAKVADTYDYLGTVFFFKDNLKESEKKFRRGLQIRQNIFPDDHPDIASSHLNLGSIIYEQGDLDQSLFHLSKARELSLKIFGEGHQELGSIYNNLGNIYDEMGEYEKAINQYQKALDVRLNTLGEFHPRTAINHNNLGVALENNGQLKEALEHLKKSLEIRQKIYGENHSEIADCLHNIGGNFLNQGHKEKAFEYFQKALIMRLAVHHENHSRVSQSYNDMGDFFLSNNQPEKALEYFEKSKEIKIRNWTKSHPNVALAYERMGDATVQMGKRKEAIVYYEEALKTLESIREQFAAVSEQAYFTRNLPLFESAINNFHKIGGKESIEQAFVFSEKSKGLGLLEAIRSSEAKVFAGLPDSLLLLEDSLQNKLAELDYAILDLEESYDTSGLIPERYAIKSKLDKLILDFENKHPTYHQLKYNVEVISIPQIQKMLKPNQALIEYTVGDSTVYIFKIQKDNADLIEVPLDFPLDTWIKELREGLYGYFNMPENERTDKNWQLYASQLTTHANLLHEKIITPLGQLPKELIIVPDGLLNYIPFNILLTKKNDIATKFQAHEWLGKKHIISYNYSSTLWSEMKLKKTKGRGLLAFAPSFGTPDKEDGFYTEVRSQLNPLAWNVWEVENIKKNYGGEIVTGAKATSKSFEEKAAYPLILHLATHAKLDDRNSDYSYLAFSDIKPESDTGKVFIRELYNLDLPLEMVVLSACETGLGRQQKGEGIISLSRGFAYAGAKSIVHSLWSANDQSTAQIMVYFYQHLAAGKNKDEALWAAQMKYLNTELDERNAHPFFWAGFVPVGDMSPLPSSPFQKWKWLAIAFIILIIGYIIFRKK